MPLQSAETGHDVAANRRWLEARRARTTTLRARQAAVEAWWSWGRLATFLFAAFGWIPVSGWAAAAVVVAAGSIAAFVVSIVRHQRHRRAREAADAELTVLDESLRRCGGEPVLIRSWERPSAIAADIAELPRILESGPAWTLTARELDDLDVFAAPVGVFGLLNRSSTVLGARQLAEWLENPLLTPAHIEERQQAVRWLEQNHEARIVMLGELAQFRLEGRALLGLIRAVQTVRPLNDPTLGVLRAWSLVSGLIVVAMLALMTQGGGGWLFALLGLLVINAAALLRYRGRLHEAMSPWQNVAAAIEAYGSAASAASRLLPGEGLLGRLRERLARVGEPGCLPGLARRSGWTEHGGLVNEILNAAVFYDLHVATAVLNRVVPNQQALLEGLSALASLEAFLSLACFAAEQRVRCYPIAADDTCLCIESGVHPLVHPARVVANSVRLDARQRIWLITGSNMSGKSTFIRMTGIAGLLAQVGAPVTAARMTWRPARLVTNLRANDNLARNESYFLAEVRQLRRMVLPPEGDAPLLGLIDEPLRGTNSAEQTAAGLAVLEFLLTTPHLFILATHDRRLTELADGATAANFHFQENLNADGLVFDYQLRPGPAQTRNALRFLEREGYPARLVQSAREWVGRIDA